MMRINAKALEKMLYAIEEIIENVESEFPTQLQKLERQSQGIQRTILREFIKVTRILAEPPGHRQGQLIVITGIDKSGKETQAFNVENRPGVLSLYDYLVSRSLKVLSLSLPSYQTVLGSLIASYLGKEDSTITMVGGLTKDIAWVLWSLDRAQHNQRVEKWLESSSNNIVLSKRWTETNIAYQKPLGISEQRILQFERNLAKANFTIVLDVPVELVFRRMESSRELPDKYETPEFLSRVSKIYKNLELFYPIGKVLHIDGSGPFEEVNTRLIETLSNVKSNRSPRIISERFY